MNRQSAYKKAVIWSDTIKGAEMYPLGRSEQNICFRKHSEYLHTIMHRPGQTNDWN